MTTPTSLLKRAAFLVLALTLMTCSGYSQLSGQVGAQDAWNYVGVTATFPASSPSTSDRRCVAVSKDGIYVGANYSGTYYIEKYDNNGAFVAKFSRSFATLTGIAASSSGNVYGFDAYTGFGYIFSDAGVQVGTFGAGTGSGNGKFNANTSEIYNSVAVNSAGLIYVTDCYTRRVQVFNSDGSFNSAFGTSGSLPGQFNNQIANVAVGPNDEVLVIDWDARVTKFSASGAYLGRMTNTDYTWWNKTFCASPDGQLMVGMRPYWYYGPQVTSAVLVDIATLSSDTWRAYNVNSYRAGQANFLNATLANDDAVRGAAFDPNGNVWMIRYSAAGGTNLWSLEKFSRRMRFDNHSPTKGILLPSVVSAVQQPGSQTVDVTYRVDMTSLTGGSVTSGGTATSSGSVAVSGTVTTAIVGWLGGIKNWAHLVIPSVSGGTSSAAGAYFWSDMYDPTTLIDGRFVLQDTIDSTAVDATGNVYVTTDRCIRKISPSGNVTTLAGLAGYYAIVDDVGATARFYNPRGICVDALGNLYSVDLDAQIVRKITPSGQVTTIAGYVWSGGSTDGIGSAARFYYPTHIAVDANGILYVCEYHGQRVRKLVPDNNGIYTVSTIASDLGYLDGIAVDSKGNIFAAATNGRILKIDSTGIVTVFAGAADQYSYLDGTGTAARFNSPRGLSIDLNDNIYLVEENNRIRKITPAAEVTTVGQTIGSAKKVAVDSVGSLYVAETSATNGFGRIVRKGALAAASQGGILATEGVLGAAIQTGSLRTVSWDVSKDLPGMNFASLSFEILAKDNRPEIGAHFVTIPADSTAGTGGVDLKISNRPVDESDLSDLWVWLLAQRDPRIQISGNTIVLTPAGQTFLANAQNISDASDADKTSLVLHTGGTGGLDNNWSNWGSTTNRGRAFAYKIANYRPVTAAEITRANTGRFNLGSVDHYSVVNLGQ